MKSRYKLFALMPVFFAATAFAGDEGLYVVGQIGKTSNVSDVQNATSYGASVGFQFDRVWASELSYTSLVRSSPVGFFRNYSANAISAAAVVTSSFNEDFSVLWRFGIHRISEEVSLNGFSIASSNASGLLVGLAGQYQLNPSVGFRAGIDLYNAKSKGTMRNLNLSAVLKY